MMIYEFRELLPENVEVSDEEYRVIEDVYMWHPSIRDKKQIADLYTGYGMSLIMDMVPRANVYKALVELRDKALADADVIQKCIGLIEDGNNPEDLPDDVREKLGTKIGR